MRHKRKQIIIVGDRVLIQPDTGEKKSAAGLYLPPNVIEKQDVRGGIIVEVIKGKGVNVKVNDTQSIWLEIISDENDLECWADEWAIENKLEVGEVLE